MAVRKAGDLGQVRHAQDLPLLGDEGDLLRHFLGRHTAHTRIDLVEDHRGYAEFFQKDRLDGQGKPRKLAA